MDVNNITKRKNPTNNNLSAEISPKRNIPHVGPTNVAQGLGHQPQVRLHPYFGTMPGYAVQPAVPQFPPGFMPPQCPPIRDAPNFGPGLQFPQRMWGPYDASFGNYVALPTADPSVGVFGAHPGYLTPPPYGSFQSVQRYASNMPPAPPTNSPRMPFGPPPPLMGHYTNVGVPPMFNCGSEERIAAEATSRERYAHGRPFNARKYNETRREDACGDSTLPKDSKTLRMDLLLYSASQKGDDAAKIEEQSAATIIRNPINRRVVPRNCEAIVGQTLTKFFKDQLKMNVTHRPDGTCLNSVELMNRMVHIGLRGARMAEKISFLYRSRPCFKRIDTLCARMQQDVTRQDNVLPNINSQGISWAVKDFIFVFTRIMSAWLIMRGYVYSTPEGLDAVRQRLCPDFFELFDGWQQITARLLVAVVFAFLNLHDECQDQKTCKTQEKSTSPSTGASSREPNRFDKEFYDDLSFLVNLDADLETPPPTASTEMVDDSEETQLNAMANGTYFKTGCYKPLPKQSPAGASVSFSGEPAAVDGESMDDSDNDSLSMSYGCMSFVSPSNVSGDACVSIMAKPTLSQQSLDGQGETSKPLKTSEAYEVTHQVLGGLIDECSLMAEDMRRPVGTPANLSRRYMLNPGTVNSSRDVGAAAVGEAAATATSAPLQAIAVSSPLSSIESAPTALQHSASDGLLYRNTFDESINETPDTMPSPASLADITSQREAVMQYFGGIFGPLGQQPSGISSDDEVLNAAQVIVAHTNARHMATALTLEASLTNSPDAFYRAAVCVAAASYITNEEVEHARQVLHRNVLATKELTLPMLNEAAAAPSHRIIHRPSQQPNSCNDVMSTSASNENLLSNIMNPYGENLASSNPYALQSRPSNTYQSTIPSLPSGFGCNSANKKTHTEQLLNTPPPGFRFNAFSSPSPSPGFSSSFASHMSSTPLGLSTTPPEMRAAADDDAASPPTLPSYFGSFSTSSPTALPSFETSFLLNNASARAINSDLTNTFSNPSSNPSGNPSSNPLGNLSSNSLGNLSSNPLGNSSSNPLGNSSSNPSSNPFNASSLTEGSGSYDFDVDASRWSRPKFNAHSSWSEPFDAATIIRKVHEPSAEMASKINILKERMCGMKHMQYFFKFHFTRNYFPDLMPHLTGLLDLYSIIKKSEIQGYTHIFEMIHEIRLIVFTVRKYLQENPCEKLKQILIQFETEFEANVDKYPLSKLDYVHIQGNPSEKIYTWNIGM